MYRLDLCEQHDVVACDINPAQLAYAEQRIQGGACRSGTAERVMGFGRRLMPLAGWSSRTLGGFLELDDPSAAGRVLARPPRYLALPHRLRRA